jgi:hypothetical protein
MQDPLNRADHYRNEAVKYHELAKYAQPAFLGDFYRRIAVRYMFMAEDLLKEARALARQSDDRSRRRIAEQHQL